MQIKSKQLVNLIEKRIRENMEMMHDEDEESLNLSDKVLDVATKLSQEACDVEDCHARCVAAACEVVGNDLSDEQDVHEVLEDFFFDEVEGMKKQLQSEIGALLGKYVDTLADMLSKHFGVSREDNEEKLEDEEEEEELEDEGLDSYSDDDEDDF